MAMVSRSVFLGARRAAFGTTLGIAAGCMIWAIASAAGVAAVLAASETAYDALRLPGAAYLVWVRDPEPAGCPLRAAGCRAHRSSHMPIAVPPGPPHEHLQPQDRALLHDLPAA